MITTENAAAMARLPRKQRRLNTRRIGPARWARARLDYVTGNIGSLHEVAAGLGVIPGTVQKRAIKEQWLKQRQAMAEQVTEQVEKLGLPCAAPLSEAELARMSHDRAVIAHRTIGFAHELETQLRGISPRLQSTADPDQLLTLCRCQGELLNQLCRLAGLPEAGKLQPKPKPEADAPARSAGRERIGIDAMTGPAESTAGASADASVDA